MSKEIKIEIKNRFTGSVLFEYSSENNTLKNTLVEAVCSGADLRGADLYGADLRGADLYGANLREADLREADLREADLREADLREANLYEANLCEANLYGADLREADLREANLHEANLHEANLRGVKGGYIACPSEGSFIGWKKASGYIVKLRVLDDSRRSSAGGEKCRCDKAFVVEIQNLDGAKATSQSVRSDHDANFIYTAGVTVEVSDYDADRWNECAQGIHFFIDRRAAVEY